jgi:hypothetical protein
MLLKDIKKQSVRMWNCIHLFQGRVVMKRVIGLLVPQSPFLVYFKYFEKLKVTL